MDFATIYYPGLGSSIAQAAQYTGEIPVHGVRHPGAPLLIHNLCGEQLEPPDISRTSDDLQYWVRITWYLTSAKQWYNGYQTLSPYYINPSKTSMAQHNDVEHLRCMLKSASYSKIVLFGCSKGAATMIAGTLQIPPAELSKVKLVVAEAPFDTIERVIQHRFGCAQRVVNFALRTITEYRPESPSPLQLATMFKWPESIPLVIILSDADDVVPRECTENLIAVLKAHNPRIDLTVVCLSDAPHHNMSMHNASDTAKYIAAMNQAHARIK